jgi:hypothetical protein
MHHVHWILPLTIGFSLGVCFIFPFASTMGRSRACSDFSEQIAESRRAFAKALTAESDRV